MAVDESPKAVIPLEDNAKQLIQNLSETTVLRLENIRGEAPPMLAQPGFLSRFGSCNQERQRAPQGLLLSRCISGLGFGRHQDSYDDPSSFYLFYSLDLAWSKIIRLAINEIVLRKLAFRRALSAISLRRANTLMQPRHRAQEIRFSRSP